MSELHTWQRMALDMVRENAGRATLRAVLAELVQS